jgi:drug/metabolite transporter (DMT)-like permease
VTVSVEALALLGAVLSYGVATLLLSRGALGGGGIAGALRHPAWLTGVALQAVGFVLAFLARSELPLLIVQPATTASIAVAYALGAALGYWPVRGRDLLGLAMVVVGIAVLGRSALPGPAALPDLVALAVMAVLLVPCAVWTVRALDPADATATRRGRLLASLAGTAFGVSAFAARVLAADPFGFWRTAVGLLAAALLVAGTLIAQLLFTSALARGGMTGPSAIMHVVETVGPAVAGVLLLGDAVRPGYAVPAGLALPVALAGCIVLLGSRPQTRAATPQTSTDSGR